MFNFVFLLKNIKNIICKIWYRCKGCVYVRVVYRMLKFSYIVVYVRYLIKVLVV